MKAHAARLARLERRRMPADDTDEIPINVVDLVTYEGLERPTRPAPLATARRVDYRAKLHLLAPLEGGDYAGTVTINQD